jgi:hypothetical protein
VDEREIEPRVQDDDDRRDEVHHRRQKPAKAAE